ncbi:NADP-dependent oxidoreductase [Glycomyces arizonensis]|uniref:NADP-dependent oxidoreductase n=1 Tax=Glycomyces arizonensis TaxID=256035 RepID=UPI00047B0B74|nr:NADP-dependent oxidoreductase [Glycomyces arizonensis]
MKAVILPRYGGAQDLEVADVPKPPCGPGEVLIRLKATSVNPVDWQLGAGRLDSIIPGEFPLIPGWDAAGTVVAAGAEITDYAVLGYVRRPVAKWGTYAEYTIAEPRMIAPKPASLDWDSAAGLSLVGLTAVQTLDAVAVKDADTILIHAAAGGVGSIAVQVAKARGARVIGTASPRNRDYLVALGAEPVEYGDGLLERVRRLAPDGIDAALDAIGGEEIDLSIEAGADPSRVVSIADPKVREKGGKYVFIDPSSADLRTLTSLAESKQLIVPVSATFPLERAAEAWEASQTGKARGKIVLKIA